MTDGLGDGVSVAGVGLGVNEGEAVKVAVLGMRVEEGYTVIDGGEVVG